MASRPETRIEKLRRIEKGEAHPDALKEMLRPTRTAEQQEKTDKRLREIEKAKKKQR